MPRKEKLKQLPLFDHLAELRRRIVQSALFFAAAFVACWLARDAIYDFAAAQLARALKENSLPARLVSTGVAEGFSAMLSLVVKAALAISLPWFGWQSWRYVAPGLYREERRALAPFVLAAPALFAGGVAFAYFVALPAAFGFLVGFVGAKEVAVPLVLMAKVSEYIELAGDLLFAFGVCFLAPAVLVALTRLKVVDTAALAGARKWWGVGSFVVAAVLTPPDVMSQVMLAVPLCLMFECAVFVSRKLA